jgi:hypothetical protein
MRSNIYAMAGNRSALGGKAACEKPAVKLADYNAGKFGNTG